MRIFCFVTVFAGKQNREALTAKTAAIPALPEPQKAARTGLFSNRQFVPLREAEHGGSVPIPNGFGASHLQMSGPSRRRRAPSLLRNKRMFL